MKHLKTRYIILLSVLAVLLAGNVIFFSVTAGRTEERDGLLQNSRMYMRDVYYADSEIHYVMVNDTFRRGWVSYYATVQKLENGEWVDFPFYRGEPEVARVFGAFGECPGSIPLEHTYIPPEMLIGEYRLVESTGTGRGIYYVGYFTITADMLPDA